MYFSSSDTKAPKILIFVGFNASEMSGTKQGGCQVEGLVEILQQAS